MKPLFVFLLTGIAVVATAQNDTTLLLPPGRLDEDDVVTRQPDEAQTRAFAATRALEPVTDLPHTVYVVTAEEILRNGYVTLVDVLRNLPGIRVSQPGNAIEGETFLLRGLSGNQYVKVLINDVPVKAAASLGLPIGAQLPIRQAARIEVVYGGGAALYGHEACGAVVNIVLKESERPIFTQADLSFGSNRYNSLDLLFGGRLGRDKRIFRFSLFGSSTLRERTDLYWDPVLFDADVYVPFGLDANVYRPRMNFRPQAGDTSQVFQAPVAHESRLLGLTLKWRGLNFTYLRMGRIDHSALGRNPLATSWHNATDRLVERQEMFSLDFKTGGLSNSLSVLNYQVDKNSLSHPVFDRLSSAVYAAREPLNNVPPPQLLDQTYARYASSDRFASARGIDARFETRLRAPVSRTITFDAGLQGNLSTAIPLVERYARPPELVLFTGSAEPIPPMPAPDDSLRFNPRPIEVFEVLPFLQLDGHWRRFRLTAGASLSAQLNTPSPILTPNPQAGALYHVDSTWTIVANYSTGFRRAPAYGQVNSFRINRYTGAATLNAGTFDQNETTATYDLGLRAHRKNASLNILGFYQQADGLYRDGYFQVESDSFARYGWQPTPGRALELWGLQASATLRSETSLYLTWNKQQWPILLEFKGDVQYAQGKEWFGDGFAPSTDVRNQPRWIAQFRYTIRVAKLQLTFASNRQSAALSKTTTYQEVYRRPYYYEKMPKYRTWEIMARGYLSNHFLAYVHVQNVFNRHYGGLDATGTVDDLLFNPQQGRTIRLGINYNMD